MNAAAVGVMVGWILAGCRQQLRLHGRVIAAELPFKGEEVQAEHVEGGHACREETHQPEDREAVEAWPKSSLLQKPASGGIPLMAMQPMKVMAVTGIPPQAAHQPHVLGEHRFVTHHLLHRMDHGPDPRNSMALKKAWVTR